jgi:hypothetical protein
MGPNPVNCDHPIMTRARWQSHDRRSRAVQRLQSRHKIHYIVVMTRLLEQALEAVRMLSPGEQDDIARIILQLAGQEDAAPADLSPDERDAIKKSKAAAVRGEFASEEQVRAVWAKHGL